MKSEKEISDRIKKLEGVLTDFRENDEDGDWNESISSIEEEINHLKWVLAPTETEDYKTERDLFVDLIGEEKVKYIEDNNWVTFDRKPFDIYNTTEIEIEFLETDNKGDTVIHCTVCYNEDDKVWFSENCIDSPDQPYDTYEEMRDHLNDIEDEIIDNGFNTIDLP